MLEELHDLAQLFLFLVRARNLREGDAILVIRHHARPSAAKVHHLVVAAHLLTHQKHQNATITSVSTAKGIHSTHVRFRAGAVGEGEAIIQRRDLAGVHAVARGDDLLYVIMEAGHVVRDLQRKVIFCREAEARNARVLVKTIGVVSETCG